MNESAPLDLDGRGFLRTNLPPLPEVVKEGLYPFCDVCEKLNGVAHDLLYEVKIQDNEQHYLAACTYMRALQALQAAYFLVRLGLSQDAAVCLRTSFEAIALLRAWRVNPELAFKFVAGDEHEQLKMANANIMRLQKNPAKADLVEQLQRSKLELEKSKDSSSKVSTYDLAHAGGLGDSYDTMWRIVSKYAHVSPRALDEFIDFDEGVPAVSYGPDYREAKKYLLEIAKLYLVAQGDFGRLFSIEVPKEQAALGLRYTELAREDA